VNGNLLPRQIPAPKRNQRSQPWQRPTAALADQPRCGRSYEPIRYLEHSLRRRTWGCHLRRASGWRLANASPPLAPTHPFGPNRQPRGPRGFAPLNSGHSTEW